MVDFVGQVGGSRRGKGNDGPCGGISAVVVVVAAAVALLVGDDGRPSIIIRDEFMTFCRAETGRSIIIIITSVLRRSSSTIMRHVCFCFFSAVVCFAGLHIMPHMYEYYE